MAKNRRPKPRTNTTAMTTDHPADAVEASDTPTADVAAETIQPEVQPEPIQPPAPSAPKSVTLPKDVLRAAFNKRTIDAVADDEWVAALKAVSAGKLVLLNGAAPHLRVTPDNYDPEAPLPAGVASPISVLNAIVAGML